MSYPGGQHESGPYGYQADPFTGQPLPHGYGTGGYQQAPPIEQQPFPGAYPGYEGYPGGPGRPPRKGVPIIALAVGGMLLLAVIGAGLLFVVGGREDDSRAVAGSEPSVEASAPTVSPESSSEAPSSGDNTVAAVTPGWQGVLSRKEKVAYDVPRDWTVGSPGLLVGFEDKSGPRTIMHGVATYKDEACPNADGSYRGQVGFMSVGKFDPREGARIAALLWAEAAAELPENSGEVARPSSTPVKVADGAISAWKATAVVDLPAGSDCPAPRMKVTAVGFTPKPGGNTAMFILYTDLDVPDALPDAVAGKIIASLRPQTN